MGLDDPLGLARAARGIHQRGPVLRRNRQIQIFRRQRAGDFLEIQHGLILKFDRARQFEMTTVRDHQRCSSETWSLQVRG